MKRFIAGAQCPQCKNLDTLFVETRTNNNEVACSRCDYHDVRGSVVKETNEENEQETQEKPLTWH